MSRLAEDPPCRGISPLGGTGEIRKAPGRLVGYAGLAQSVEQLICNQQVVGSIPTPGSRGMTVGIRSTVRIGGTRCRTTKVSVFALSRVGRPR